MNLRQFLHMAWMSQQLMRSQWWSIQKLRGEQNKKFIPLFRHAANRVPAYKRLLEKHGVRPAEIQSLDDIIRLPILYKPYLQDNLQEELVVGGLQHDNLRCISSSGTTGTPTTICFSTSEYVMAHRASYARFYRLYGRKLTSRIAYVGPGLSTSSANKSILSSLIPHNLIHVNSFTPVDKQIELLVHANPDVITGYGQSIEMLAEAILDQGVQSIRPAVVYCGAEPTSPRAADKVRRAFDAFLYDTYNCTEFGNIAWGCPSQSGLYHVNDELLYIEVVSDDGRPAKSGETGEILVTSLTNFTQPMIRMALGDRIRLTTESCSCGRNLTTLDSISGRCADRVQLPDGRIVSSIFFMFLMDEVHGIREYQFEQLAKDEIILRIVPKESNLAFESLDKELEPKLGMKVAVSIVDEIAIPKTGKRKVLLPIELGE